MSSFKMKTKITIVIDHLGSGGAQMQVFQYLKFANRARFDITVINLDSQYDILGDEIKKLGIDVIGIPHRGFFNLITLLKLIRLFKTIKPDIVHTYLFTADCYGRLAAKLSGVKIIICAVRNLDVWMKPQHILADKILARFTDRITINAESIRPYLIRKEKIDPQKIELIYNGMDLERFTNLRPVKMTKEEWRIPPDALVVGMIGRFSEQKDYETFFQAAQKVLEAIPNIYFLAVGDGPRRRIMEEKVQKLGIADKIIFTGRRQDIPDLIAILDVGVLSSHAEGCPNVILEYMAEQKAVIASDVGGCQELVRDKETGFIVPENDASALAAGLIALLSDERLRLAMGIKGRQRLEKYFTAPMLARNTEQLYQKLLEPKVAFIFSQFPAYDETFILRELNQLKEQGVLFTIYSLKTPQDKIVHEEAQELARGTVYLPFFSLKLFLLNAFYFVRNPFRYLSTFARVLMENIKSPQFFLKTLLIFPKSVGFSWIARKNKISSVHGQWATYPASVAYIISRFNDIPFSFTGHAHDLYTDTTMLAFKIKQARFVTTCTANNKEYLLRILGKNYSRNGIGKKIMVNRHGIDLSRFKRPEEFSPNHKLFTILSVGSLLECKGFSFLIDACKILKDQGLAFHCIIAGGGKLEKNLRLQIQNLNLQDTVELTGYITQDRLIPLYQHADVFVLAMVPEIHWGIPNVLIEAAAAGVAVVCTMLPSIPELVKDGKTGFIIPPKNPDAIADAVMKLYANKTLRKNVVREALKVIAEKFDTIKNARQLKELLRQNS